MPRPIKCRKVCQLPDNDGFLPVRGGRTQEPIVLNVDEYETIRLIDREDFSQEHCGEAMHIARTTVQQIYANARKKLANALVEGRPLQISGGNYRLCDGNESYCTCGGCARHRFLTQVQTQGGTPMKIAIPLDENKQEVCMVLARAPYFLFWENGTQTIAENPAAQAQGGAGLQVAQFLVDSGVTRLITPRCGQNAAEVFAAADITILKSAHKAAANDLAACLDGALEALTHFHGGYQGIQ